MKITNKVLLVLVITIFGLLSITTTYELSRLRKKFESESHDLHRTIAANLVENLSAALFNVDRNRVTRQIQSAFQFGQINRIVVLDDTATPLGAFLSRSPGGAPEELTVKDAAELGLNTSLYVNARQEHREKLIDSIETEAIGNAGVQRLTTTLWFSDDDRRLFVGHLILEFDNRAVVQALRQAIFDKLLSAFFLALVMCGLTFVVLQLIVLRRLESLKVSVKNVQARDYSRPIDIRGSDEIAVLAQAFRDMVNEIQTYQQGLEAKVQERTRDLQKSRDKIKTILDNIEQGIVTFAADMKVDNEYSRKTLDILDLSKEELLRHTPMKFLIEPSNLSHDRINQIDETLKCTLGNDDISWMANHHALPVELEYSHKGAIRILGLEWIPLIQPDTDLVERLLLTIRDLTQVRLLEQQRKTEAEQNDRILTLVKISRKMGHMRIQSFLQNSLKSLEKVQGSMQDRTNGLILLHTLKGEARTLQLRVLADDTHDAETTLKNDDAAALSAALQKLHASIQAYMDVMSMLHHEESEPRPSFFKTVTHILDEVSDRALQAGIRYGGITVTNRVENWDNDLIEEVLSPSLTHALNNALDHGYIFPEQRHREGRKLQLSVNAWQDGSTTTVEIKDEGYGIDNDLVLKTAQSKGLAVGHMRVEDILFLPEFSTAASVSGTSGRGVGMAAIKTLVESRGGELKLESRPGQGSVLTVRIPAKSGMNQVA